MKYETAFDLGDPVFIVDLDNTKAVVVTINIGADGITYKVQWFHEGRRNEGYLFVHELAPAPKEKP